MYTSINLVIQINVVDGIRSKRIDFIEIYFFTFFRLLIEKDEFMCGMYRDFDKRKSNKKIIEYKQS